VAEDQVDRIFKVIWIWYGLLRDARQFLQAYAAKDAFACRQESLGMRLDELQIGTGGF
jgi:hypothetical protein